MKPDLKYLLLLLFFLAVSCKIDDAQYLERDELGATKREFVVEATAGSVSFEIYASRRGHVLVTSGKEWLHTDLSIFDADASVNVEYLANEGLPRMGTILLETDTRRDTIRIKQEGLKTELFEFPQTSVIVYNGLGDTEIPALCNVGRDNVDIDIQYVDDGGWIRSLSLEENRLVLSTEDNTDPDNKRMAYIRLSFTDSWNTLHSSLIRVTQTPSGNNVGDEISFSDLRALYREDGTYIINDDYCITGYVVSRAESGNMGENEVFTINYIDYEADTQTAYIESPDGRYGFRIRTATSDDNVFRSDTKVKIMLTGASLRKESDPERYMIEDVTAEMVLESVAVPEHEIPARRLHIGDLQDSDIYTYVTLLDCEIPVRKGCLTPINEGYTRLFNSHRVSKFPIIVRDIEGSSLYMYTNTTCPYRRTGARLPYGKGTVSGIIVHEKYRSFIDKDDPDETRCGNIGRYQIRHTRYEDLALEDDIENSFSALLTEYRYMNVPDPNPDGIWLPTYGNNGYFTHTRPKDCYPLSEYSYLGPCGSGNKGNVNGFGIILPDGTDYGRAEYPNANSDGKGASAYNMKLCWRTNKWWNTTADRPECWLIAFSTAGISSHCVSMQIAVHNRSQELQDPRYWAAEWSFQGDVSAASDDQWHLIAEYVVPDVGIDANTLVNQSLGFKQMDFPLPNEILGHEKVFIRLRPISKAAGSGYDYDESSLKQSGNGNAISYFAIRYNK